MCLTPIRAIRLLSLRKEETVISIFKATFTENWLVYHYYDDEYQGPGQTKGYKMVTVELYEGKQVDEKTKRYSLLCSVLVILLGTDISLRCLGYF